MPAEEPSIAAHASELVLEFLASRGLASDEVRAALEREASSGANSSGATSESKNSADGEEAAPAPAGKRDPSLLEGLILRSRRAESEAAAPTAEQEAALRPNPRPARAPAASGAPPAWYDPAADPVEDEWADDDDLGYRRVPLSEAALAAFVGSHRRAPPPPGPAERDAIFERYEQIAATAEAETAELAANAGGDGFESGPTKDRPGRAFGADAPTPAPPVAVALADALPAADAAPEGGGDEVKEVTVRLDLATDAIAADSPVDPTTGGDAAAAEANARAAAAEAEAALAAAAAAAAAALALVAAGTVNGQR